MSDSEELKPCPCCKSDAVLRERDNHIFVGQLYSDRYPEPVASQNHGFRVRCCGCGLQTCWWHYPQEADAAWDARTEVTQADLMSRQQFEDVTRPVIEWLNANFHPHTTVVIDTTSAEISEGIIAYTTKDYLKG